MWVAGSEPEELRALGTSTNLPEKYGVDVMWRIPGGVCGIQRKELSDLLASVQDGRLGKEIIQMRQLDLAWLVVEGEAKWTTDGWMATSYGKPWSRTQFTHLIRTVASSGCLIEQSNGLKHTIELVGDIVEWTKKEHTSLFRRPGPVSVWGKADCRDYQLHLIQGLPGIGLDLAERIIDALGMPFTWRVTREELASVKGLGKKKVDAAWAALA